MMDDNENKFENFSNFNQIKREQLVDNFSKSQNLTNVATQSQFEAFILEIKFPKFDENDNLIETLIRYSILYLEEFNYDLKQRGLFLLDHLMVNVSPSVLNLNMRSKLILSTFEKYINDKEGSLVFLDHQMRAMLKLLNIIESNQSSNQHNFKQHSLVLDSLLSNAYMTTNHNIKTVYFKNLKEYVIQMNIYSCRHLSKLILVGSDCGLDIGLDFDTCLTALDLIECIIKTCWVRIHAHGKELVSFLIKLVYLVCLEENESSSRNLNQIQDRICCMLKHLFTNSKLASAYYEEFNALKQNKNFNIKFLNIIQHI